MKNDVIITLNKNGLVFLSSCDLGVNNENYVSNIIFKFKDEFVNGNAWLEIKKPSGTTGYVAMTKEDETYKLPVLSSLLSEQGKIKLQLRITKEKELDSIPIYKSKTFYLIVTEAINSTSEIPEEYPSWIDKINQKLEVSNIIAGDNITLETNEMDITISSKDTIYDDTEIKEDITNLESNIETINLDIASIENELDNKQEKGDYALKSDIPDVSNKLEVDNIIAGDNITLSKSGNNITINSTGGGSGTTDYTDLTNKPKINNVVLSGNKSLEDLGIVNYDDTEIKNQISNKQDNLVSGTNIKTINNESLLGSGNITISGGSSSVDIDNLTTDLKELLHINKNSLTFDWELGSINGTTGAETVSTTRIRTNYLKFNDNIVITPTSGYKFIIFTFLEDNTFSSSSGWQTSILEFEINKTYNYRLLFAKTNDSTIDISISSNLEVIETYNDIENRVETLEKGVYFENLSTNLAESLEIEETDFNIEWERGTIDTATGTPSASTTRLRTPKFQIEKSLKINVNDGYKYKVFEYTGESDSTLVRSISLFNTNQSILTNNGNWFRFILANDSDSTITTDASSNLTITYIENEIRKDVNSLLNSVKEIANSGTPLEYTGNIINAQPNKNYMYYNAQTFTTRGQDGDIYNNHAFLFGNDGSFKVYDLDTKEMSSAYNIGSKDTIVPHCNSVCFGNEFYDGNDNYPLIYINAYNNTALPKGTCYAHRIIENADGSYTTNLIQTISIGFTTSDRWISSDTDTRPYGNFVVDTDNNYLYVFTLRDADNTTRFFKFNLPKISDGTNITLNESDILEQFDTEFFPYIQGVCYFKNRLYVLNGLNSAVSNFSALQVIDLNTKNRISNLNLTSLMSEPEAIFINDNQLYIGQSNFYILDNKNKIITDDAYIDAKIQSYIGDIESSLSEV